MRTVARVMLLVAGFTLPFVLWVWAERRSAGAGMILLLPIIFTLPLALSAVAVFSPIEWFLDWRGLGHLKNAGVPLLGAAAVALLAVGWLVLLELGEPGAAQSDLNARTVGERVPGMLALGGALGAVGGALWRLTDWAATLFGFRAPL